MEIRPFRGWRFVGSNDGEVGPLLAPPYDVLTGADKQRLLAGNPNNIVAVDMPHVPPKQLGPRAEYEQAAQLLGKWKAGGVLRQDAAPCVYVYEQTYAWSGRTYVRRGMIAGVRATELGVDVIPHEHVFAGPIADRLKLTELTRMQLSPIFGFYEDPAGTVGAILGWAAQGKARAAGVLNGVTEKLWTIDDAGAIAQIAGALASVPVFIADGHHRYTTALSYRKQLEAGGQLADDHEAKFVMFALVAKDDPGLLILPTHRLFSNLDPAGSVKKLSKALPEFSWKKLGQAGSGDEGAQAVERLLAGASPNAMALVSGSSAELWLAELAKPAAMVAAAPDENDTWRALPSAIISKLIIDKGLKRWSPGGSPAVEYTASTAEAIDACRSGRAQLAVCLKGIPIEAVEAIARLGSSMPHKSTYFYPKIATGMVLKPLV
jgi:uncharacterized protein (DUF1015 family)